MRQKYFAMEVLFCLTCVARSSRLLSVKHSWTFDGTYGKDGRVVVMQRCEICTASRELSDKGRTIKLSLSARKPCPKEGR